MRRFASGDATAMELLVSRHGGSVYAFVRRFLGAAPLADDVYQDVWLKVIRNADRFEGRSRFSTWLFQVTRNVCMDHLRARRRRRDPVSLEHDGASAKEAQADSQESTPLRDRLADDAPGTHDLAAAREELSAVEVALASLPDEQREVFLLREKTEHTFDEIARIVGISPNTAKSRMRYALENLRRALKASLASGSGGKVAHGM